MSVYDCIVRFPCWNVRNFASLSCLTLFGKYFSRILVQKEVQVTSSSLVYMSCCMPAHQYSAFTTSKNVMKVSFCASGHSITLQIFSHSLSHASASSRVDLPMNFEGLCLIKSSIVTGRVGATTSLGCAAMGCIISTIWCIACAISSAPTLFLIRLFAKAWARHISLFTSNNFG